MQKGFYTNYPRFSVRNKAAANFCGSAEGFSVFILTSKTDYLRIFSPFSYFMVLV